MRRQNMPNLLLLVFVFVVSGCVVRTYPLTKDRIDQDLTAGNRGYLKGTLPEGAQKERKATRTTQVVEIELHSPIKFEKMPKAKAPIQKTEEKTEDKMLWGNQGFIMQRPQASVPPPAKTTVALTAVVNIGRYTVQKGDTLQKISQRFYGTTKKWMIIYEANKDVLKGPNKIYPGQVLNIPVEPLVEEQANLK